MSNKPKSKGGGNQSTFELLERRDLFSATLPLPGLHAESLLPSGAASAVITTTHAAKVQAVPSVGGTGLTGEYFTDSNFQTGYVVRADSTVNIASRKTDSATQLSNSVRWTGQLAPVYTEAYSFSVVSNGGVRLWVNGQLLIDQASSAGGNVRSTMKISLVAGQKYSVELEYTRHKGVGTNVKLMWSSLHQKLGVVPQKALFPDTTVTLPATSAGLIGKYYIGKNFNQLVMQRVDPTINFNFKSLSPTPLIPAHTSFSIRWTGQIIPTYSETYTFKTTTDDGVRLYVDDQLIIDDFTDHTAKADTAQITLVAGQACDIRMDYYQDIGVASAQLQWSSPSQPLQVVPASAFSSTPDATAGTLTSVASATDGDAVDLSWTGSSTATGYSVQQSTDGGTTFSTIATTAANVTTYKVDNLNQNTAYSFRVVPLGSTYTSIGTEWSTVTTATESPTGVTATPASSSTANVTWNDVPGENGFVIYEAPGQAASNVDSASIHTGKVLAADAPTTDGFVPIGTVTQGVTSFTATGLTPGASYQFIVRSVNSAGAVSDPSPVASAVTLTDAPENISNAIISSSSVILNWADTTGETGFTIERSLDNVTWTQIGTTDQGVTTYTDSTIAPGTEYFYRIRSADAGGLSDPSPIIDTVTATLSPGTVTTTGITAAGTTLNWADVANENGFAILESTDGGNTFSQIATTPQGVTSFPITGLVSGTNYQFAVEAINSAGNTSTPSATASIVTLPAAPTSLVSSAVSTTSTTLSWLPSVGTTGFILQRSTTGVDGWTTIATLPGDTLTYTDTTVAPGTTYFYQVQSTNASGASDPSSALSTVTTTLAPSSLTSTATTAVGTLLNWTDVPGETGFIVLESADGGNTFSQLGITLPGVTSLPVTGLVSGSNYQFAVEAVNAAGTASDPSSVASVVTLPTAPTALLSTATTAAGTTLSWAGSTGATGYVLQRSLTGTSGWTSIATLPASTLTYTDNTLAAGTSYYYQLSAVNSGGTSAPSPIASALTIPAVPTAAITGLSATQSQVSWIAVSGASQYLVQRSSDGNTWTTVATATGSATTATLTNLANSTMYYYRVQASNATGASPVSAAVSQVTAPLAQYAIHNVTYGTTATGQIYAIDLTTGSSNWIGTLPVAPRGAVRDPISGVLYFYKSGTSDIYEWDPTTGNTYAVDTSFIPSPTASGAYLPDGTSYIVGTNGTLYKGASGTLSVTTIGTLTMLGTAFTGLPTSMTFSPNGTLFMTVGANLYTVNTTTAVVTPVATTLVGNILATFGPKGLLYMTTPTGGLYSYNLSTLVQTLLGNDNLPVFTSLASDVVFTHLSMTATASPTTFSKGGTGAYEINISNTTGDTSSQPISVTTTLQSGVTFASVAGSGWTATISGQNVTLTYANGVAANGQLPTCTLTLNIATTASSIITTTLTAATQDFDNNLSATPAVVVTLAT